MTPTDAARQLLEAYEKSGNDISGKAALIYIENVRKHHLTIARALLDAEARIAALEAVLRKVMQTADQCYSEHPAFKAIYNLMYDTLTPEGGGK